VADALFQRFPQAKEGQLSRLRASLVNKEALAELARGLDIGAYLNLGAGELRSGGQSRDSILADALEALFAAVYLDAGYAAAQRVILSVMREPLARVGLAKQAKDPKTRLQEYLQSRKRSLPIYGIKEVSGSQHAQTFRVVCSLADNGEETSGAGGSRRRAEQDAAQKMLRLLGDV
jgi:ribonuclease-3